jgi:hypothetical protein
MAAEDGPGLGYLAEELKGDHSDRDRLVEIVPDASSPAYPKRHCQSGVVQIDRDNFRRAIEACRHDSGEPNRTGPNHGDDIVRVHLSVLHADPPCESRDRHPRDGGQRRLHGRGYGLRNPPASAE